MPDVTANSHRPAEDRFLDWVDALVDPAGTIPVPDADVAELAGTAAFVQRAAGPDSAPSLSTDRTESMWEEIMHASPTTATLTPTLPASTSARNVATRALPKAPSMGWRTWLPTALLIAAIVVAGFAAAWRIAGPFDLAPGGGGRETANQPGIAGSATPAASADGCPLTNDMLVFSGEVPTLNIEGIGPSLAVVEPDGDFVITCGGVDDPAPLMTGVTNATALQWPGTVLLERDDGSAVVVNVATGQQAEIGDATLAQAGWAVQQFSMPWLVTPSNASATDWRFTNLDTMNSFMLSDELGGLLKEGRVPTIQAPHDSSVAVISFDWTLGTNARLSPELAVEPPPGPETATLVDVPTESLVVDSTLQTRRWIDASGSIAVSLDGSTIAYQTQGESGSVIRIEDAESGDPLAELGGANFAGTPATEFAFDGDGDALVYLDGNEVWIATWDGGLATTNVETGDMRPSAVHTGKGPDRVLVERLSDEGGPRTTLTGNRAISLLDTEAATITHVDGLIADNNNAITPLAYVSRVDYAVTVVTAPDSPDQMVMHLVDVATGETVVRSEPTPATAISESAVATYSGDGAIAVINLDGINAVYLNANTGTVAPISIEPLSSLDQFAGVQWIITPSHDGRYLYALGEPASATPTASSDGNRYFSVSLLSSDPNWPLPSSTMPKGAILGIPAGGNNDELAILDAQDIATATPAPTAAADSEGTVNVEGCALRSDIPFFPAGAPEGVPGLGTTYAVVEDGNLTVRCPSVDEPEPLMTGVTNATPLPWPGTVLLELDSGEVLAYNIATDQRIGFGDLASTSASVASSESPWMLIPVGPDLHITNLQTMHKTSLAVIAGGKLPDGYSPIVISSPDSSVAVITDPSASPSAADEMPGTALVIDESLEMRRWIDVQGQVTVGDGVIAYETRSDGQPMLVVEDAKGGETLLRLFDVDFDRAAGSFFAFAGESTLVYIYEGVAHVATHQGGQAWSFMPSRQVGTSERRAIAVHPTGVPGRVLVEWISDGSIGEPGEPGTKSVSILDVVTGELTDVDGLLRIDPDLSGQFEAIRYLVTIDVAPDTDARTNVRMTDIATGETVLTSEPVDASVRELIEANNVFGSSLTGDVVTISPPDGTPVLLNATTGLVSQVSMDGLPATTALGDLAWHATPSSDGALLFAIGRPLPEGNSGVDITSPNALPGLFAVASASSEPEWSEPVELLPAGVIVGIPAGSDNVEPSLLEAREVATTMPAPTPAPSPDAGTAGCDLDADIPVVAGSDLYLPGTVLRLVDGTLSLECDAESRVVAEGVAEVIPGSIWPGAVLLRMDDGSLRGINLITGAEGDLGAYGDQSQLAYGRTSRWIFFPTTPEQLDWRIIDLETMESFLLSDELGGVLPHSTVAHLWATTPDAAVIGFGGTPVLPPGTGSFDRGATPAAGTPVAALPADWSALVIDGSLDNRRWIETSRSLLTMASISPDGELLAYSAPTVDDGFTVRVERLSDGVVVAETGIELGGGDAFLVFDGGLLHLAPDGLDRVTWDDNGEVTVERLLAFDESQENPVLRQTTDPNIVVATVGTPEPSSDNAGYLVDVASGVVTEMPGLMPTPFLRGQYDDGAPVGYVLAAMGNPDSSASTVQMYDVATGQPVLISDPVDLSAQELAMAPAALRGDVGFVFLPDGRTVVLDAASGEAFAIDPPEDLQLTYQMPSPSGDLLAVASGNRSFVRAVSPDGEWIEVQPESQLWFLPGSDGERR